MNNICQNFSGVVIDQNHTSTGAVEIGETWWFQSFRLPENYPRGTISEEIRSPGLSGFQLLATILKDEAAKASLDYVVDQYNFGTGWDNLLKGKVTGCHADGARVWFDVFFDKEIPVDHSMLTNVSLLRIGFRNINAVEKVWYSAPNPYHQGEALEPALPENEDKAINPASSFNFRILALSADSGTDYLGNPYRSDVIRSSADNPAGGNANSGYWLSGPQPSKFAVVSHYADLRPFPATPTFGAQNLCDNPSFEYDVPGTAPALWTTAKSYWTKAGATVKVLQNVLEAKRGQNYAEVKGEKEMGLALVEQFRVGEKTPVTFSIWVRTEGLEFEAKLGIGDGAVGVSESSKPFKVTKEWERQEVTLIPTGTGITTVAVAIASAGPVTFFIDGAMINPGTRASEYFDGDSKSAKWENARGLSGSVKLVEPELIEDAVVVDSVLIDPITPGVGFNIYYSNDLTGSETSEPTTEEWEKKLWIHVPQTFVTAARTTYVLPEPIVAKFIKIEFSDLQPRNYNPGDFQKPIIYKKFPDWVSEAFLTAIQSPNFIVRKVGVVHDALELAHDYYLDDLKQGPIPPILGGKQEGPVAHQVDPETLAKINQTLNTFTQPPASLVDKQSLLGNFVAARAAQQINFPVESRPEFLSEGNASTVSGLDRQAIVLDQSMPVMFFYVTCRHEYKELMAEFEDKKAYFAGLNEVAFMRHTYTTMNDGELYIETGADDVNTERNDFAVEDLDWFTY